MKDLIKSHKTVSVETFSKVYPEINNAIFESGDFNLSRNGPTKEFLNFKTEILNPYRRCSGGYGRDINVFFFLAEALWIFLGQREVKFLEYFNSRMSTFSDNGTVFHAPYGFRLRHYGIFSDDISYRGDDFLTIKSEENKHAHYSDDSLDQVKSAIRAFHKNPDDRRVVLSIWSPLMDLEMSSKDIPCNDLLMYKVRDGKLHATIANRSNDLHWGLPTNVFQFSFISEIIAYCLGLEMGTQTHNSQSLHVYTDVPVSSEMYANHEMKKRGVARFEDLYEYAKEQRMVFENKFDNPVLKFDEIETYAQILYKNILSKMNNESPDLDAMVVLEKSAPYFANIYKLISIYIDYKNALSKSKGDHIRIEAILAIWEVFGKDCKIDIVVLAINFFARRIKDPSLTIWREFPQHSFIGKY